MKRSPLLRALVYRALSPLLAPLYRGAGAVLVFHRVVDHPPARRSGHPRDLEITSAELERVVTRARKKGYAIVALDEALAALAKPARSPRFCVLTFDDGYRDWITHALPVLSALSAPFTIYVATGFPDRTLVPWAFMLERLLSDREYLDVEIDRREARLELRTSSEREHAFARLIAVLEGKDGRAARALGARLFGEPSIAAKDIAIGWSDLGALARHPLVTVGAHTMSHPVLCELSITEAMREMHGSKRILEERLAIPVRHFAYPYGCATHAGAREFVLAEACGFDSAVTARAGNVFAEHARHRAAIPRAYGRTVEEIETCMTGVVAALRYRGKRVVTA